MMNSDEEPRERYQMLWRLSKASRIGIAQEIQLRQALSGPEQSWSQVGPERIGDRVQRLPAFAEAKANVVAAMFWIGEEGRARYRCHSGHLDEAAAEVEVVAGTNGLSDPGHIGHGVVSTAGTGAFETDLSEDVENEVARFCVVCPEALVILVGQGQGDNAGVLEWGRRPDGQEIVDLADSLRYRRRGNRPADPPARDGVGLRNRVDGHCTIFHSREGTQ